MGSHGYYKERLLQHTQEEAVKEIVMDRIVNVWAGPEGGRAGRPPCPPDPMGPHPRNTVFKAQQRASE